MLCLLLFCHDLAWADRKEELNQLRDRIGQLQRDLAKSEESRSEAADALRVSEKAISEVNRNLVALGREQAAINRKLNDIKQQIDANRTDAARQQELLDRMIRHQYMHGNTDGLRLMLEGKDLSEVERQLHYFGYVSRTRAALIGKLKRNAATLLDLEAAAREQQAELATNAVAQKAARSAMQTERYTRQKVFNRLKADISKNRREIGKLKRDEDRLSKLIEQLAKAIAKSREERKAERKNESKGERKADSSTRKGEAIESVADETAAGRIFATLKGKLKLPVRGELHGRFGSPREDGGVTWKGLFIKADSGRDVRAVADGQVVYADWLRGYGNLLVIDHGGGYMSLYGNNESLLKQVGDTTQGGESIASVGSTGGAEESGVYFELRHEGKPFDPMKWVGR